MATRDRLTNLFDALSIPIVHQERGNYDSPHIDEGYMVIELHGKLLRLDFMDDSYGNGDWDGSVRPVKSSTKTVTVYE
jgi:hypothetical protein